MSLPADLKYTESHEWVRVDADGTVLIGITDHAQEALGDIVFIELPAIGKEVNAEDAIAVVESVKAASDIYAPVAGEVVAINEALASAPEQVNQEPYNAWLVKLKVTNQADLATLLSAQAYQELIGA